MKIGVIQAILWTLGVYLAMGLALLVVAALRPHADPDPLVAAGVQSAVYLASCSLFAARRPGRTWSDTFAMRRTSVWVVLFAFALGVAMYLPALTLAGFIEHLRPMSAADKAAREAWFVPRSLAHGVALFVFAGGVAVFSEELLFRGALYTALRPLRTPASAGWIVSLLFVLTHGEPRFWLSILAVAVLLAVVRAVSGSLWPSLFLHGAFNATALAMPYLPSLLKDPSPALVLACLPMSAVILGVIVWIGRASPSANRARQVDLEPDPGLGETQS